jgi:hypothetical protein
MCPNALRSPTIPQGSPFPGPIRTEVRLAVFQNGLVQKLPGNCKKTFWEQKFVDFRSQNVNQQIDTRDPGRDHHSFQIAKKPRSTATECPLDNSAIVALDLSPNSLPRVET